MKKRTLTIIDTNSQLTEINLDSFGKKELNIGRKKELCDIVIPDNIVSKEHGTFCLNGNQLMYKDNDSSNGTFIGMSEEKQLLSGKDGYIEVYDKSVLRIGNVHSPDKMVLILYRCSEQAEVWKHVQNKEVLRIGRGRENDIVLPHPGVSRMHCLIRRQNGKYVIYDQKTTNGVMVNGQTIREPRELKDKDLIQILDFQLMFSAECIYYKEITDGISVRVNEVNKFVGKGKKRKQILRNVSCEIGSNEFVAIIGGSGAGKTTLMNAISGFEPQFTGEVLCNNINLVEQFQNLKNIIGFVPQQDIIYENLTLRRMLMYTAKMKMPKDTNKSEINKRIDEVLEMVELGEHQNTYIRKLSGGQKKRASIAVELLADPKLFFLDEPTSGLDPGTEKNLMTTLNHLSKSQNKTIIMVTHTTANLHLCDKVIFMGPGGRLCFCGNVNEAKEFYRTDDLVNIYNMIADNPQVWAKRFAAYQDEREEAKSKWTENKKKKVHRKSAKNEDGKNELFKKRKESAFRQYRILSQRYGELLLNDRPRLMVLMLQPFLIAILLYLVADENIFDIYESTKSMLFALSCSGIWIGLFNSIQEICKERVIVKREYMANLKLPGYIMSKFTLQALLGFVQSVILTGLFLLLVGKDRKGLFLEHFHLEMFLTVWLTVLVSITMGFVISAFVKTGDKAMAVAPFVLIVQLLFSGILFVLEGAGEKISYCTVSRWSVEALGSIANLNSLELKLQADYPMLEHEAETFFEATKDHILQSWGIMFGMIVLCTVVSIIVLRRIAKDSR
ncbi:MAG: FHA domain-containing protein [Schaedlerella sp.]|nr:FHA domain-containing protein [Schaedlerella sp.]